MAQIAQIVAIATRQQSQPTPPPREVIEEPRRSIEKVQKLGAKPYDGSGDLEAAWLWLDRVNKVTELWAAQMSRESCFPVL